MKGIKTLSILMLLISTQTKPVSFENVAFATNAIAYCKPIIVNKYELCKPLIAATSVAVLKGLKNPVVTTRTLLKGSSIFDAKYPWLVSKVAAGVLATYLVYKGLVKLFKEKPRHVSSNAKIREFFDIKEERKRESENQ